MASTDIRPPADGPIDETRAGWAFELMLDPRFATDPRPFYRQLRRSGPLRDDLELPGKKPTVVVARHKHVEQVLRNPGLYSSRFGEGAGGLGNDRPLIPLQIDPPQHKKYRVLLDPYFSPRRVAPLEDKVSALVNDLIDEVLDRGGCEFTSEFAVPLPCTVFLELLGLPLDDLDFFLRIKEGIVRGNGKPTIAGQQSARAAAGRECCTYFASVLDDLARHPRPGLLGDLLAAEVDGVRLTRDEVIDICYLFILAGLDTVTDSLCCFWAHLAAHPERRRRIVEDPAVVPSAVEELLRWESPVAAIARTATAETRLGDCPVHEGDGVLVFIGAANTDDDAFAGAGGADFDAPVPRHYAFGGGIHRCLGSHLARLELRAALREWHRRIPAYRLADGAELSWTPMLRSVTRLPLVFGE